MKYKIGASLIISLVIVINSLDAYGQVLEKDSLALVALYDSTGGDRWISNTNWKEGPVDTWFGITTQNNRVRNIELSSNNLDGIIPTNLKDLDALINLILGFNKLAGEIPTELGELSSLFILDLQSNNLEGHLPSVLGQLPLTAIVVLNNQLEGEIPSNLFAPRPTTELLLAISNNFFSGLPELADLQGVLTVFAENNHFTFEDIEPNLPLNDTRPRFIFSPQKPVYDSVHVILGANSRLVLEAEVGGSANRYQWYKDDEIIPGAVDATLILNDVSISDAGSYTALITSEVATDLTIERLPVKLMVFDRPPTLFCSQTTLDATIEDATATYVWNTGATTPLIEVTEPGTYRVTIETASYIAEEQYVAELALTDLVPGVDISFDIQVNGKVLDQNQVLLVNGPVQFRNTSKEGNSFRWDFGDGTNSDEENTTHVFESTGTYIVHLEATDEQGCNVVMSREVQVQELFVANAITPNGDGDNDQWHVEPFLYPSSLRVINRWGQEVYYAADYQDDFDGTHLQTGVYFYELVIEQISQTLMGNINIIK